MDLSYTEGGSEQKGSIICGNITAGNEVSATKFVGALEGNADTATKLATSVTIAITDGTNTGEAEPFDGSSNISIKLPTTIKAGTFVATSDKRLKENITPYNCEKSILDLPVYKYNFINGENKKEHIGCLAQDLQEICPEIVNEGKDGYLAIEESKIVYLLLEEVKKLREEIKELVNKG